MEGEFGGTSPSVPKRAGGESRGRCTHLGLGLHRRLGVAIAAFILLILLILLIMFGRRADGAVGVLHEVRDTARGRIGVWIEVRLADPKLGAFE